jgi:hypothetical protein
MSPKAKEEAPASRDGGDQPHDTQFGSASEATKRESSEHADDSNDPNDYSAFI